MTSSTANTANLGFLLAKALQRWNELLSERFGAAGFGEIRPAYGSILLPLFEEEGLRMGDLAQRSRLSKQALTTLIRDMRDRGLVRRIRDPEDGRAYRIYLSARALKFRQVAEAVLAQLDAAVEQALSPGDSENLRRSLGRLMELELKSTHATQEV